MCEDLKSQIRSDSQKIIFEVESSRIIDLFYKDQPMVAYEILQRLQAAFTTGELVFQSDESQDDNDTDS